MGTVITLGMRRGTEPILFWRDFGYNSSGMKRTIGLLLVCLLSVSFSVQDAAVNIEKRLSSLQSLQADFEQVEYAASISTPLREKGKFYFQRPDLMRWEYLDPERNVYLYKEGVSLAYYPDDNQLLRRALSPEEKDSEIFALLTGARKLEDTYIIEAASFPSEKKVPVQLKLTPKQEGEFSYILLEANERTWLIEKAVFFDWAGNKREFHFSQIKANPRLGPKVFELELPPDCEIIDDLPTLPK
jgi:outer membrane lipoprotein carrier protein